MNQPLAYVHPGAKIAKNVVIEPFTTIHNNVVIGEGILDRIKCHDHGRCPYWKKCKHISRCRYICGSTG
jgi:acyl-[acyl carrier protein]--UDP-N-acetylglucosamine O-acyltransferase